MATWSIIFIYSDDCKDCIRMKNIILDLIETHKEIELLTVESSTDKAIEMAIKYGIDDIPGCWVDPRNVICGKNFDENKLKKAITNLIHGIEEGRFISRI